MSKDKLNDENYGTRDKRGHWKPFGTISINPPSEIFLNPIKLLKYFFNEIIINDDLYVSFADNDKGYFKYIDTTPIEFENHIIYKVKRYNNGQFEEEA